MSGPSVLVLGVLVQSVLMPARSLDQGPQSSVSTARQVAVREAGEWTSIWRQHAPAREQPAVDFSREMVVGVFLGTRPTAGFAVQILGYRENGEDLVVQYRENAPSRDVITAQMLTSPYHLVVIPKRTGKVTFERVKT